MILSEVVRANVNIRAIGRRILFIALTALILSGCGKGKLPDKPYNKSSSGGGALSGTQKDFKASVGNRIFFETDSASLTIVARAILDKQAGWLVRYPHHPVTIEGHADERGTREYNLALGARRAAATRDYLVGRGVARNRVRTISYGKERPVAVCNNIGCWSQNRRVITVLSAPG